MSSTRPTATTGAPAGDAAAVLERADHNLHLRRRAAVDDLRIVWDWARIHSHLDGPEVSGGPKLIRPGGAGTPEVVDLALGELAIARQVSVAATRSATADVLDLAHRLPAIWAAVQALDIEVWVARKIARQTRPLSPAGAKVVDQAVAGSTGLSPSHQLELAEAKIVEADPDFFLGKVAATAATQGVWISEAVDIHGQPTDPGHRNVFARIPTADSIWLDSTLSRVADILAQRPEHAGSSRDQLRAAALATMGRPGEFAEALGLAPAADDGADPDRALRIAEAVRPEAVLYVHITPDHLAFNADRSTDGSVDGGGCDGVYDGVHDGDTRNLVARVEGHGPFLTSELSRLLGHCRVTLRPVIDLNQGSHHTGYEHPTAVKERSRLRMTHDAFPHSSSRTSGRIDHDHVQAFDSDPPPDEAGSPIGQTGDHNSQPLTRLHHRIKTHTGIRVRQIGPASYLWVTPHGLHRIVSPRGTDICSRAEAGLIVYLAADDEGP